MKRGARPTLQQLDPQAWIGAAGEQDLWPDAIQERFRRAVRTYLEATKEGVHDA